MCDIFLSLVSPFGSVSITQQHSISTVILTCTTNGGPNNRFQWTELSTGTVLSNSAVYYLTTSSNARRNIYQCTVFNEAGNGTATVSGKLNI